MADIDIGSAATDRGSNAEVIYTRVDINNPANLGGRITSVEIWADTEISDCEVATFIHEGSDVLSTRDSETLGTVTADSKQTFSGLDMTVEAGDYIGIYGSAGLIEQDNFGDGYWWASGDQIPCTSKAFTAQGVRTISLYGEGEIPAVGRSFGFIIG